MSTRELAIEAVDAYLRSREYSDFSETPFVVDAALSAISQMALCWKPISELKDRYASNLLLCAPELVDADCNEAGVGLGYWQDDRDLLLECNREPGVDYSGFLACKWNMTSDEWNEVSVTPTHFMLIEGPN